MANDCRKAANDKNDMDQSNEPTTPPSPMIPGGLRTTAMAILPHREVDRALDLALSLDIPFWPQLPHAGYYEDMYVQASEHFPGMVLDPENNNLHFDTAGFLCRAGDPAGALRRAVLFRHLSAIFRGLPKIPGPGSFRLRGDPRPIGGAGQLRAEGSGRERPTAYFQ